ncbi:TetR family transcriptional regulator [Paenibacillus tianjinensis]|uniref:TetR family transcriptional regulator n=1 Tax=Paenibacillus tianjinensis TaxID=2810347 RepID=A0ABX7LM68_9BACL|nr:TetR family transcriptional regulator [Paenibacillus tianjinensis]
MRNAEATRERILEAAMAEFSAHGIAGARVDRIAKNADCNKNMIYIYFENKEMLFTTILQKNLTRVYEEITFTPDDLPGYAVRVFDFAMSNPDLMRLMAWFSLEQKADSPVERGQVHDQKVKSLTEAQNSGQVGAAFPPEFILTTIMTIATAWTAANPFGPLLDPKSIKNVEPLRDAISRVVRLISLEGLQN